MYLLCNVVYPSVHSVDYKLSWYGRHVVLGLWWLLRCWRGCGQGTLLVEQIAAGAENFSSGDRVPEDVA